MNLIPTSYDEWRHCITEICKIALTPTYIQERLQALRNPNDRMTARFQQLYGNEHLERVIGWFERAAAEQHGSGGGAT